jgi:Tfp pilus assembly protein PilO
VLRIEVKCEGSYADALSFLNRLTTFPKILTVNSVDITPGAMSRSGSGQVSGKLEITFNLSAFILDSNDAAGAQDDGRGTFRKHSENLRDVGVTNRNSGAR